MRWWQCAGCNRRWPWLSWRVFSRRAAEISLLAEQAGLARQAFAASFAAAATRNSTFRDFLTAQALGMRGFPTLIAGSRAKGYALVRNGYRPPEDLLEPLELSLAAGAPVTASA